MSWIVAIFDRPLAPKGTGSVVILKFISESLKHTDAAVVCGTLPPIPTMKFRHPLTMVADQSTYAVGGCI